MMIENEWTMISDGEQYGLRDTSFMVNKDG